MKQKLIPIVLVSTVLGLLFDFLFWGNIPGISIVLYAVLLLGGAVYLARILHFKFNPSSYLLMPMVIFFATFAAIRANPFLIFCNTVMTIYLLLLFVRLNTRPHQPLRDVSVNEYGQGMLWAPLHFLVESGRAIYQLRHKQETPLKITGYLPILRGLLFSLPLLLIFIILLSSADPVFQKYAGLIFGVHVNLNAVLLFRVTVVLLVIFSCIGAYWSALVTASWPTPVVKRLHFQLGSTEMTIMLGSVSLLFLSFLIIQFSYFFGGTNHIMGQGYTYAEYARRGFFELTIVAILSMALLWQARHQLSAHITKQKRTFKWLSGFLIAETIVIMLSAHERLSLYEQAYGFTTLRLISHIVIGWLAIAFLLLALYIIREASEKQLGFGLFIMVISFISVLNIINPDAVIARQNISRLQATHKLDIRYLADLSPDAVPILSHLLNNPDPKLQKIIAYLLYTEHATQPPTHWQSSNLGQWRAERIYRQHAAELTAARDYQDVYMQYQSRMNP